MSFNRRYIKTITGKHLVRFLSVVVFLYTSMAVSQSLQGEFPASSLNKMLAEKEGLSSFTTTGNGDARVTEKAFKAAARKNNIATRKVIAFKSLYNGYYLVAGVFGSNANSKKFVKSLQGKGLNAKAVLHPENGMHYVYVAYATNWREAVSSVTSALNGAYQEKLWIMDVQECKAIPREVPAPVAAAITNYQGQAVRTSFQDVAAKYKIPARSSTAFSTAGEGYYIIAGVYGSKANADSFRGQFNASRLATGILYNPQNQRHYVYIGYYPHWQEAIKNSLPGGNGLYKGDVWILEVLKKQEVTLVDKKTDAAGPETTLQKYELPVSAQKPSEFRSGALKDPPEIAKLIKKADAYFHKMWYAEAAELYEMALSRSEHPTPEVIQKAGDSHYFNTNMERAYHWYDILYNQYKKEMSAENLFKYAHTLKGTGRYGRAKRLMRLYNHKKEQEGSGLPVDDPRTTPNEVALDNILQGEQRMEIKNLAVNSKYSDFAPMFYNGDEVVFASSADSAFFHTRRYKWNNQPFLDLYVAKINEESQEVRDAIKFSKKVNTKYHEAAVTFSPDNKTMYFTRNNYGKKLKRDKKGVNNLKIYMSKKVDGEWTEASELPFNSDDYSTGHPALSPDGKQLYFVSDMPGSIGETDIFVVDVLPDGSYSEPRNLGPEINTEHKEMFPFINNKKLYFSSNGHVGLGGLDVYEVAFDETDGFLEVRNMGRPINSSKDDFSYIVNEETQKGYFASNRKGGKGDDDIYSFKRLIPEETNENAIAGVVTELVTGDVLPEALVELLDENNRKLKEIVTGDDGAFVFEDLEGSTKYTIRTVKPEYFNTEQAVTTRDNEKVTMDLALKRLDERIVVDAGIKKLKMDMIYFDFDKSYIRKDAASELDKLVEVMHEYKEMVIRIESHTDSRGPAAYNKYLSDKRAKATRAYLLDKGIAPERIESAIGYGEEHLLNGCDGSFRCSSEQHQRNRRSEFIIVHM